MIFILREQKIGFKLHSPKYMIFIIGETLLKFLRL
jgi:hypothetical protein